MISTGIGRRMKTSTSNEMNPPPHHLIQRYHNHILCNERAPYFPSLSPHHHPPNTTKLPSFPLVSAVSFNFSTFPFHATPLFSSLLFAEFPAAIGRTIMKFSCNVILFGSVAIFFPPPTCTMLRRNTALFPLWDSSLSLYLCLLFSAFIPGLATICKKNASPCSAVLLPTEALPSRKHFLV